jgi:large subunit ribosomal protein L6
MPTTVEKREEVEIPKGVTVTREGDFVKVKGPKGELKRIFIHPLLKVDGSKVAVSSDLPKRKVAALVGTWASHIKNMIIGVTSGFEYKMKVVYAHFPIKTRVDKAKSIFYIENFLGEKNPRKAKILEGVDVTIKGEEIIIKSPNIEHAGQTAANIEKATIIKNYDPKVFQDGVYITQKPGEE